MYRIEVDKRICQLFKFFYRFGFWHRGDEATVKETSIKLFYSIYTFLFPISLMAAAFTSEHSEECIFSFQVSIAGAVLSLRLLYLIWQKKEILDLLNRICVYSIEDHMEFSLVNEKLKKFMKYLTIFLCVAYFTSICANLFIPFLEKKLFVNIEFPLDYKHNEFAFWMAYLFLLTESVLCAISVILTTLIWYLMLNCALKYEALGHQIKNIGFDTRKQNSYLINLITTIESHKHINKSTNQMESFISYVFLAQILTSGLCICGSIYMLTVTVGDNYVEYIMQIGVLSYIIFDIFMMMYFGNEIKLSSDQLLYCLFESNWIDQRQSTKKYINIFGERLKKPHVLVIVKLYKVTLETFITILRSAYSMFNILQSVNTRTL